MMRKVIFFLVNEQEEVLGLFWLDLLSTRKRSRNRKRERKKRTQMMILVEQRFLVLSNIILEKKDVLLACIVVLEQV
jgi:hypothetical protein